MSHRLNHKHSSDIQIVPKISAKKVCKHCAYSPTAMVMGRLQNNPGD